MKIKIKDHNDLNRLIDSLANEIVDANIYHRIYCDLINSIEEYGKELNLSQTFWYLTFSALRDAKMIRLCRVFDQESTSLNLFNLLEFIKENIKYFDTEHFKERLKDNAFVDSLAKVDRRPNLDELERDIRFTSIQNPLVKKLMLWRNNIIAHLGIKVSLGKEQILQDNQMSQDEIESLLNGCYEILNRYSYLFKATSWSKQIVGHADYKDLLEFIRLGLKKFDESSEKEIERYRKLKADQSDSTFSD